MTFPVSPANGQVTTVNGITYTYSSTDNSWTRSAQPVGNLTVSGNTVTGKLYTTEGLYWAGNGNVIVTGGGGGGGTFTAGNTTPTSPNPSDFWYYIAGDVLFQYMDDGDSEQWVDVSSPYNTQTQTVADAVLSNVTVSSWANVATVRTSLGITPTTIGVAPPVSPSLGDTWYNTSEDVMYQYINDGVGDWWVDISSDGFSTIAGTNLLETTIQGNLLPSANITYNLGSTTQRFKDLWLSGSTIYLGGASLSTDGANVTISNPQGGSFSVAGTTSGSANVSFGNIFANYFFANGAAFTSSNYGNAEVRANLTANPISSYSNTNVTAYLTGGNTVVGTSYWTIPVGTTAERPASAPYGATRFNSQSGWLEVYANGSWGNAGVNLGLGASSLSAASSAIAIKNATATTTDGFYWINLPTVGPTQVYCDMNTNGGGWMLAAKVYSNNSNFNGYSSADWTSTATFNETQSPSYAGHIKTAAFVYYSQTSIRMCFGTTSSNLYESSWSAYGSLKDIFSSGTARSSSNSRASWIAWLNGGGINYSFGSQPNCNAAGANQNYAYSARLGISMNNEGDCSSNDSSFGFGISGSSPGSYGCGASDWNSGSQLNSGYQIGYIWVK